MKPEELYTMIEAGESLKLEFKSDRSPLPDAELLEACVSGQSPRRTNFDRRRR
jgi:hypothetical protein